jgi:hypothetical protein
MIVLILKKDMPTIHGNFLFLTFVLRINLLKEHSIKNVFHSYIFMYL